MKLLKLYWPEAIFAALGTGGVVAMLLGFDDVVSLTPLFLIANLAILVYRTGVNRQVKEMILIAAIVGYAAEFVGVKTGLLFGDYIYGSVLGPKMFDVPIMVGVMWALVMVVIWTILPGRLGYKRIIITASLAVMYDLILEHFATRFGLWNWEDSIPVSNYVGWFLVAGLIAFLYQRRGYAPKRPMLAYYVLPFHSLFFLSAIL